MAGGKSVGEKMKEVGVENSANKEELACVNGRAVEQPLQSAFRDTDAFHHPFVGVPLPTQLVANKVADMNLHRDCYWCAWLPNPPIHPYDHRQKKKASNLVSSLRS